MLHAQITARAFNTPLLVHPAKAVAFLSGLGPRVLGGDVVLNGGHVTAVGQTSQLQTAPRPRASLLAGGLLQEAQASGHAPYLVRDGVAIVEIAGVLIHRGAWIGNASGQTSYEGIAAQIEAAAADPAVRGVALEIDSFGGEVAGVFDLADRIRALRAAKPVWAFVAEHAFSAGYALASQADRILLPRTGSLGSIGVAVMHADLSGQLNQNGVSVTLIHSGTRKVDANPYQPLPPQVQASIQSEIDELRVLFAQTVAAGRARQLTAEAALATEAACYRGARAVAAGLADEVTDLASGFASFAAYVAGKGAVRVGVTSGAASSLQPPLRNQPPPRKETVMSKVTSQTNTDDEEGNHEPQRPSDQQGGDHQPARDDAGDLPVGNSEPGPDDGPDTGNAPQPSPDSAPVAPAARAPLGAKATAMPAAPNLAELSAQLRSEAAEIADIAAQASRLGIAVDAAKALREGTAPDALRRIVLERAADLSDAQGIIAAAPSHAAPRTTESPIVAAAKRAASETPRR